VKRRALLALPMSLVLARPGLGAQRGHAASSAGTGRVVVAFGDSITAGVDGGYPARLAARLRESPAQAATTVVNAGIGGNRLLADDVGPSGLARFRHDALGPRGVTHVIVLIGINDIGMGTLLDMAGLPGAPSAVQIAAGLRQLVAQAHARRVKVILGTLMPFQGASYWSEDGENKRQALNDWIRGQRYADGVIDFDAAMRSTADPQVLDARYDSGDHLHPSIAGYAAMAESVDLGLLRG
jgi:lysophospholipase L1-like esterase